MMEMSDNELDARVLRAIERADARVARMRAARAIEAAGRMRLSAVPERPATASRLVPVAGALET
jgi:hypothetical protein